MNKHISGKSAFHLSFLVSASLIGATGCEVTGPELASDPAQRLEDDFGGPAGLLEFFDSRSEGEIRATLEAYELGYVTQASITDCPQTFPSGFRSTWYSLTGEHYYIDSAGRPSKGYSHLPPVNSEARNDSCQASVGQWGDAANPGADYDGGHLLGSQLGGWGARANLVPQEANFNRGNYAQLENKMATCDGLSSGRMLYSVTVSYPNSTTLIPGTWNVYIEDRTQGDFVSLNFQNASQGGSNGTSERNRGVNFLTANGCN
jgi:hypothetical protein